MYNNSRKKIIICKMVGCFGQLATPVVTVVKTSIVVFYRTRIYQMQPRKGKKIAEKRDNYSRDTAKIEIRTPLNRIFASGLSQKQ